MYNEKVKVAKMDELSPILISVLETGSSVKLTVTGNSMYPLFRNGVDIVVLKKKSKIHKYDILLYKRKDDSYVLHRVVIAKGDTYYMAGDGEIKLEFPVYKNQVVAVVKSFYRVNKHISCNNLIYKLYSLLWVAILPKRHKILLWLKRLQNAVRSRRGK